MDIQCQSCGSTISVSSHLNKLICPTCGSAVQLPVQTRHTPPSAGSVDSLLDRAMISLEYREWTKADELLEQVLNAQPRNARAYVGKLMLELRLSREQDLAGATHPLTQHLAYRKAVDFADPGYRAVLEGYNNTVLAEIAERRRKTIYDQAVAAMEAAASSDSLNRAADDLAGLGDYLDSAQLVEKCRISAKKRLRTEQLEQQRKEEQQALADAERREKKRASRRRALRIGAVVCVLALAVIGYTVYAGIREQDAMYQQATELTERGEYIEAYDLYQEMRPDDEVTEAIEALYPYMAEQFCALEQFDRGLSFFQSIGPKKSENTHEIEMGEVVWLVERGELDEAQSQLRRLVREYPEYDHAKAYYALGAALIREGDMTAGVEFLQELPYPDSGFSDVPYLMGITEYYNIQFVDAEEWFDLYVYDPESADWDSAHLHHGKTLLYLGMNDEAEAHLNQIVEASDEVDELLAMIQEARETAWGQFYLMGDGKTYFYPFGLINPTSKKITYVRCMYDPSSGAGEVVYADYGDNSVTVGDQQFTRRADGRLYDEKNDDIFDLVSEMDEDVLAAVKKLINDCWS